MINKQTSQQLAWKIRRHAIEMAHLSGGSHIGAVMSVADIIAVLYNDVLKYKFDEPKCDDRDRFILSKGHAGSALYAALAECGFFSVKELTTHYQNGSRLSGHVSHHVPGVDLSTGSLGHGLSVGAGRALAAKLDKKDYKVYVVLGDGECDEGAVWEAALFANQMNLDNLIAIVDYNKMQSLDFTENTLGLEPFTDKWKAFGWNVIRVNGNDHEELRSCFKKIAEMNGKPTVVIADTIKGCGISFMEEDILWHYRFPHDGWEYDTAVSNLHASKPEGVEDIYTPNGIENPSLPTSQDDIYKDHTLSYTHQPSYLNKRIRTMAKYMESKVQE